MRSARPIPSRVVQPGETDQSDWHLSKERYDLGEPCASSVLGQVAAISGSLVRVNLDSGGTRTAKPDGFGKEWEIRVGDRVTVAKTVFHEWVVLPLVEPVTRPIRELAEAVAARPYPIGGAESDPISVASAELINDLRYRFPSHDCVLLLAFNVMTGGWSATGAFSQQAR